MKIQVFKSQSGLRWYFRILSRNGQIVAQSEGYNQKRNAIRTARVLAGAKFSVEVLK